MRRRTGCTGICPPRTHSLQRMRTSWRQASATGLRQSNRRFLRHCLLNGATRRRLLRRAQPRLKEERRLTHRRLIPRKLRLSYSGLHLLVAAESSPRRSACATRNTASLSRPSRASSVAACRVKRTIYVSPNHARSAARSATSTWSQSVAFITASCIVTAMRPHGGPGSTSTRFRSPSSFGDARVPPARTPSLS